MKLKKESELLRVNSDGSMYDQSMGKSKQIAFQIDIDSLNAVDALKGAEFSSRAEIIRVAVEDWLARRRAKLLDEALEKGYRANPQTDESNAWADLSVEGLEDAKLDW